MADVLLVVLTYLSEVTLGFFGIWHLYYDRRCLGAAFFVAGVILPFVTGSLIWGHPF